MGKFKKYLLVILLIAGVTVGGPFLYNRLLEEGCLNLDYWGWYKDRQPDLKYDTALLNEDERDILRDFNGVSPSACEAFFVETREEFVEYDTALDDRFKALGACIKKDVKGSLDGIKVRGAMNSEEKKKALEEIYAQNYETFLKESISDLERIRDDNLQLLNERLLTDISLNPRYKINSSRAVQGIDLAPIVEKLNSKLQLIMRVSEEAFTFVPAVGDAYDIGRIFYDPRFDYFVGNDLDALTKDLTNHYRSFVLPTIKDRIMPSSYHLIYEIRSNFVPGSALARLNRED